MKACTAVAEIMLKMGLNIIYISKLFFLLFKGVLYDLVIKCLTRNPGVLGSSCTGSSGFFHGSVLGQDISEPQPSTGETQERHE